ncbi:MAG: winged helix-turn-helix domain-containing protein [Promethearchaeota archaeon]
MDKWDLISFVLSSKLRFKILIELKNKERIPTKLARNLNKPISHISKAIRELQEEGLIKCLTPLRRKNKFYTITDKGKKILFEINKMTS